jgi:recombination protein RecT
MKLAWRSDRVIELHAECVRRGDRFIHIRGTESRLEHTPGDADEMDDGNITHTYAYAKLQGGGFQFVVMTRKQVDAIRAKSQSGRSANSPWKEYFPEMAKKTAIRRLMKMLPLSTDDMRVVDLAGAEEAGVPQDIAVQVPAEVRDADPAPALSEPPHDGPGLDEPPF